MIWYLIMCTIFAVAAYGGMRAEKKSHAKSILAAIAMFIGWPLVVIAGLLAMVALG